MTEDIRLKGMYVFLPEDIWRDFEIICTQEGCKKSYLMAKLIKDYVNTRKDLIEAFKKEKEKEQGEGLVGVKTSD